MKPLILAASISIVLAGVAGEAAAACTAPSVRVSTLTTLTTLLSGNTVCVPATTVPTMTWQEEHRAGNQLWDYKRGPGHATDPSEQVGTWTITATASGGRAQVSHNYGAGGTYPYTVWDNRNGTHSFCSAGPEIVARIKSGGGPC